MRNHVRLPLTIETWERSPARWIRILGEIVWWTGAILIGMGIGWLLMTLHAAGVTP